MNLDNTSLITHSQCMDGSTCAALFVSAGGSRDKIRFTWPQHSCVEECLDEVLASSDDDVLLVDVSVSQEYAKKLMSYDRIYLLDHHKASIPLNDLEWCEIDVENNRCGSRMFFDWLLRNGVGDRSKVFPYKEMVMAVDDYDRYIKDLPESETMANFHYVLGQKLFVDRFIKNHSLELTAQELYVIDLESDKKNEFVEKRLKETTVRSIDINGDSVRIGFVLCDNYQTEVGCAIYSSLDLDCEVAVMVGLHTVSFRSRRDCTVDLSVVAKLNGGGGHMHAAGGNIGTVLGRDYLEVIAGNLAWE